MSALVWEPCGGAGEPALTLLLQGGCRRKQALVRLLARRFMPLQHQEAGCLGIPQSHATDRMLLE